MSEVGAGRSTRLQLPLGYRVTRAQFRMALIAGGLLFLLGLIGLVNDLFTATFPWHEDVAEFGSIKMGKLMKGTPKGDWRLEPGDIVRVIDGTPVRDYFMTEVMRRRGLPGSQMRYVVERKGRLVDVVVTSVPLSQTIGTRFGFKWVFFALGWITIFFIVRGRPRDPVAVLSLIGAGTGVACASIEHPIFGVMSPTLRFFWTIIYFALLVFQIPLFIHWSLRFPVHVTTPRWLLRVIYGLFGTAFLSVVVALPIMVHNGNLAPLARLTYGIFILNSLGVMVAVFIVVRTYRRALAQRQQAQIKWLVLGLCVGLLPEVFLSILPQAFAHGKNLLPDRLLQIFFIAIPVGFGLSILQHRLFDADLAIAGVARYLILVAFLLVVESAFHVRDYLSWSNSQTSWPVSVVVVSGLAVFAWRYLQRPLGLSGLREAPVLLELNRVMEEAQSPESLAGDSLAMAIDTLQFERGAAFVADSVTGHLLCVRVANTGIQASECVLTAKGQLAVWIASQRGHARCQVHGRARGMDLVSAEELEVLARFDTALVVPIRHEGRLVGVWFFSAHRNGSQPNSAIVRLLQEMAARVGRGMEHLWSIVATVDLDRPTSRAAHVSGWFSGSEHQHTEGVGQPGSIGPYDLRGVLGSGSFGTVWSAVHRATEQIVAVKALRGQRRPDPEVFARFLDELAIITAIDHPNIVRVFDFGNEQGTPWFAMELIHGESLMAVIRKRGALPVSEVLWIGENVAEGLAACHQAGIVHRDLSPSNILLSGGRVCLVDFGLAHRTELSDEPGPGDAHVFAGTPLYMSPEHITGRDLGSASDLFALGSILYQCATGAAAFKGRSMDDTLSRIRTGVFEPLAGRDDGIPIEVCQSIETLLNPDLGARPSDARAVARVFRRLRRRSASFRKRTPELQAV